MKVIGSAKTLSDRDLVASCISGDELAWRELVDRYYPFVLRVAKEALRRSRCDDADSRAEDVASDLFTELLANDCRVLTRFREPFSLKSWLAVITRRKSSRLMRRVVKNPLGISDAQRISAQNRTVASDLAEFEQRGIVRDGLNCLAPRDRLALQLFYEGGHSYKEVAQILDLPVARIGTLLARARKRLARTLGVS